MLIRLLVRRAWIELPFGFFQAVSGTFYGSGEDSAADVHHDDLPSQTRGQCTSKSSLLSESFCAFAAATQARCKPMRWLKTIKKGVLVLASVALGGANI